jgi:hypothetical protein
MRKASIILSAIFLIGLLASAASAITIGYDYVLDGDGVRTTTNPNAVVMNFNDQTFNGGLPFGAVTGDSYAIVQGSVSGQYAAPGGDGTYYLSTPAPRDNDANGYVSIALTSDANYFGMYWGSIDSYNTISFFHNGVAVGSFTGTDVVQGTYGPNTRNYGEQHYVNFSDFTFDSFTLASNGFAFEVDNIAVAPVPEPGTIFLMGLGVAGLVAWRKKFRK